MWVTVRSSDQLSITFNAGVIYANFYPGMIYSLSVCLHVLSIGTISIILITEGQPPYCRHSPRLQLITTSGRGSTHRLITSGSPSLGGDVAVYVFCHEPTELAHSFLFCSCVYFCLYGPFSCISFHQFSRHVLSFSSSGLISASLVLSTICLFVKVPFSPDIILCG